MECCGMSNIKVLLFLMYLQKVKLHRVLYNAYLAFLNISLLDCLLDHKVPIFQMSKLFHINLQPFVIRILTCKLALRCRIYFPWMPFFVFDFFTSIWAAVIRERINPLAIILRNQRPDQSKISTSWQVYWTKRGDVVVRDKITTMHPAFPFHHELGCHGGTEQGFVPDGSASSIY